MPSLIVQWQQTCISAERHIYSPGNKVLVRQVWQVTLQCIFVQDCWETGLFISDARTLINTRRAREQWCLHLQQGLSIIFTRSRLLLWSFLCILNRLERYHCSRIRAARPGKSPNQMSKPHTLESGINIPLRLIIHSLFSRGYGLIPDFIGPI